MAFSPPEHQILEAVLDWDMIDVATVVGRYW